MEGTTKTVILYGLQEARENLLEARLQLERGNETGYHPFIEVEDALIDTKFNLEPTPQLLEEVSEDIIEANQLAHDILNRPITTGPTMDEINSLLRTVNRIEGVILNS